MNRYSLKEISSMLDCSDFTIRRAINDGSLKANKIGTAYFVDEQDLYTWLLHKDRYTLPMNDEKREEIRKVLTDLDDSSPAKKVIMLILNPVQKKTVKKPSRKEEFKNEIS